MYKEMREHQKVEITVAKPEFAWLKISLTISFPKDMEIKKVIIEASQIVKSIYHTTENPDFEIFTIFNSTATIADFSGQPPKTFCL